MPPHLIINLSHRQSDLHEAIHAVIIIIIRKRLILINLHV
jgi:hypothetical protein